MRRFRDFWIVLTLVVGQAYAAPMKVQVQTTPLRVKPAFLGESLGTLTYGQTVDAFGKQGAWSQVRTPTGQVGWVHESALAPKRFQWMPGTAAGTTGASSDEMALAGKGFSAQIEKEYRAGNAAMDYTWVDKMTAFRVEPKEINAFVVDGKLRSSDGGAP